MDGLGRDMEAEKLRHAKAMARLQRLKEEAQQRLLEAERRKLTEERETQEPPRQRRRLAVPETPQNRALRTLSEAAAAAVEADDGSSPMPAAAADEVVECSPPRVKMEEYRRRTAGPAGLFSRFTEKTGSVQRHLDLDLK